MEIEAGASRIGVPDDRPSFRVAMTIPVLHVMRTYGVHGGERQLAQLFRGNPGNHFSDAFAFVYRDDACERYFAAIAKLKLETLLPLRARKFPSLRMEMIVLLLLLPLIQIRLIWVLHTLKSRICVAHGLQAALACWPAAYLLRRVQFVYVHRGTKSAAGSHWIFRLLYAPFDAVAGVSEASARSLDPLLWGRTAIPLPNGIDWHAIEADAEKCAPRGPRPRTVIAVGRLMAGKGQALIVEAFARLSESCRHDVQLALAGDGPDERMLRDLASRRNVSNKVMFLGYIDEIICEMAASDIFVHASETEGLSNAVLEAMELALPSVVVDAPGVTECHVDGETGYVVPRDAAALAQRLLQLIESAELRTGMGAKARLRVRQHYSIDANVARFHALYARLLGV
jgi:glycosyltransferase involved in cell wall biosynthesis